MIVPDGPKPEPHPRILAGATVILMILLLGSAAWGDERSPEEWAFTFAPYIWASALEGDLTVKGLSSSPEATTNDIFTNLNFAFMGYVEGRKGPWGMFLDGIHIDVSANSSQLNPIVSVTADADMQMSILKFGGFYRFLSRSLNHAPDGTPEHGNRYLTVDLLLGGRYTSLDAALTLNGTITVGSQVFSFGQVVRESQRLVDPFIGLRSIIDVTARVPLVVEGNIGGFGIASDFTYEVLAMAGYQFPMFGIEVTAWGGYRVLAQDYSNGSGTEAFVWDMTAYGPLLGIGVEF